MSTILVVEDNEQVRELACDMLIDAGFDVITAVDAFTGLAQFNAHPEIDLIFSDVIMPGGVTGVEMAKQMIDIRPDSLILLATGYQEKGAELRDKTLNNLNVSCVSKPYDVEEIPKLIESLLTGSPEHLSSAK